MLNITKASAGSGKTYRLAYEYIKLVLGYENETGRHLYSISDRETHKKILAVTFTNKATEEMKQRIVKELAILSGIIPDKRSPYLDDLCEYYRVGEDKIKELSSKSLKELLNNFTEFNISTIDSFFQVILRTFAREAEVGADFGIELNDKAVLNIGIQNLLSSLRHNSDTETLRLRKWLLQYMRSNVEAGKTWDVFKDNGDMYNGDSLQKLAKQINNENFKQHNEDLLEYLGETSRLLQFQQELKSNIRSGCKEITTLAQNFILLIEANGLSLEGLRKNSAVYTHLSRFLDDGYNPQARYVFTNKFELNLVSRECWLKKNVVIGEDIESSLLNILTEILERGKMNDAYKIMGDNVFALGLIGDISKNVKTFRDDNDVILLSDTNELLSRIISEEDAPFIYERIGMNIKHFLIDEFQDTSRMQWNNMRPLLSESLSHNYENLIIGDVKQSIYRFRNADPSLLREQVFKDFGRQISKESYLESYSTNYRSRSTIIKFNNTFFSLIPTLLKDEGLDSSLLGNSYNNVIQYIAPQNVDKKGYVSFNYFSTDLVDNEGEAIKWTQRATELVPKRIKELLARGYKQRDIAILVNTNNEGAAIINYILDYCVTNGDDIRVVSDESLLLNTSSAIGLIISVLRYIDNNVAEFLESDGQKGEGDSMPLLLSLFYQNINNGQSPSDALDIAINSRSLEENVEAFRDFVDLETSSLFAIVEKVLNVFVPQKIIERENPYIHAFQDTIIEYCERNIASVHAFLGWWDLHSANLSITSPSDIDAVNVLTIHKSKGLEYPCVIIPFADWNMFKCDDYIWVEPVLKERFSEGVVPPIIPISGSGAGKSAYFEEYYNKSVADSLIDCLNKTYVAFTRAVDELHIFYPIKEEKGKLSFYLNQLTSTMLPDNMSEISKDVAPELFTPLEEYDKEGKMFSIGQPVIKKEEKEEIDKNNVLLQPYSSLSSLSRFEFDLPDIIATPRTQGIVYHRLMSMIRTAKDIDFIVRRSVARGMLPQAERDAVIRNLTSMVSDERVAVWFDKRNKIINERPMMVKGQSYRADRIILTPQGETIVVDYKFGEKHLKSYHKQVANYVAILRECGFTNLRGYIWYPFDGDIENVEV
ncbi:MAG: UvrD-helicase domain-containing protein [Muribaculaceae bacterium]|nr:UvrD-helicase domain-containing protein [Muribaculaceae bacterium]